MTSSHQVHVPSTETHRLWQRVAFLSAPRPGYNGTMTLRGSAGTVGRVCSRRLTEFCLYRNLLSPSSRRRLAGEAKVGRLNVIGFIFQRPAAARSNSFVVGGHIRHRDGPYEASALRSAPGTAEVQQQSGQVTATAKGREGRWPANSALCSLLLLSRRKSFAPGSCRLCLRSSVPRRLRIAPSLQSSRLSCPKSRRSPLKEPSKAQQFRSRRAPTRARSSSRASPQPFGRPCTGVGHARRPSSRSPRRPRRPCSRRRARRACSPQPLLPWLMRQRPSHKWKRNHSALHQC